MGACASSTKRPAVPAKILDDPEQSGDVYEFSIRQTDDRKKVYQIFQGASDAETARWLYLR
jgi:hypothetical protein